MHHIDKVQTSGEFCIWLFAAHIKYFRRNQDKQVKRG